jgi:phosphohistidine phosphatase
MDLTLLLIRHAQADARGASYPDDSRRPLVAKGFEQSELLLAALTAMRIKLDHLYASPFARAAQTAEPLCALLRRGRTIAYLDSLADSDYARLLTDVRERCQEGDTTVALVGHEPLLGELASLLLTGERVRVATAFRKSAVLILSGSLAPDGMTLDALLPMRITKALLRR